MNNDKQIKNGDVFDIGQTINGVYKFLWVCIEKGTVMVPLFFYSASLK